MPSPIITLCIDAQPSEAASVASSLQLAFASRWSTSEANVFIGWEVTSSCGVERRRRARALSASSCKDSLAAFVENVTDTNATVTLESSICTVGAPPSPPSSPPLPLPPMLPPSAPPRLPPLPLAPPPHVLPRRVRSAALTAASVSSLTVEWQPLPPTDEGTFPVTHYRLWACRAADDGTSDEASDGSCVAATAGADTAAATVSATVSGLPSGQTFTLAVEAFSEAGSSGNASVAGGAGQAGPVFTTHGPPARPGAPHAALTAGLDNESSVHAIWWPPYGNGLPLLSHELLIDSGATDEASLVAAAELEAVCDGSGSGGAYVDTGCWHPIDADPSCGAAGHPLCRLCEAGGACPPRGALRDAAALPGGGLRLRLASAAGAVVPMQAVLRGLPPGSTHNASVRAFNALGAGSFSLPGRLATAGEPPILLVASTSALTATVGAATGGGLAGAVVLAVVAALLWKLVHTCRKVRVDRRDKAVEKKEEEEAKEVKRPKNADQLLLWQMLDGTLARTEVGGVDDAQTLEVSKVLTYLAKEQQKVEKEEQRAHKEAQRNRLNAMPGGDKDSPGIFADFAAECRPSDVHGSIDESPANSFTRGSAVGESRCTKTSQFRPSAVSKLGDFRRKKDQAAGNSTGAEADRLAITAYLQRYGGVEPLQRRNEKVDAYTIPLWSNHNKLIKDFDEEKRTTDITGEQVHRVRDSLIAARLPEPSLTARGGGACTTARTVRFDQRTARGHTPRGGCAPSSARDAAGPAASHRRGSVDRPCKLYSDGSGDQLPRSARLPPSIKRAAGKVTATNRLRASVGGDGGERESVVAAPPAPPAPLERRPSVQRRPSTQMALERRNSCTNHGDTMFSL